MRVLIVDDEVKVCQLILHLVDWSDYGMDVIGIINDGDEAYDIICREKPDIVITDIRMPGMDGIDLVANTLKVRRDTYFIIISGYSQFEYARRAVSLGVEDYLVKPIKKKELQAVLDKICDKYNKNHTEQEEKASLKVALVESRKKIKNNFLQSILTDPEACSPGRSLEEVYQIHLSPGNSRLLLVQFYENLPGHHSAEQHFVMQKIEKLFQEKLQKKCTEYVPCISGNEILFFLSAEEPADEELEQHLKICLVNCSVIREIFPKATVSVGIGKTLRSLEECGESLKTIRQAMLEHYRDDKAVLFWEEEFHTPQKKVNDIITPALRRKLQDTIEIASPEAIPEIFGLLAAKLKKDADSGLLVEKCIREWIDIFLLGARNYEERMEIPSIDYYLEESSRFYTIDGVLAWLADEFSDLIEQYRIQSKNTDTRLIRQAKQYIQQHYGEPIGLETVSSQIGLNPAYFSSMFKKATGQNFMNYLTEIRVENAKMFLMQSDRDLADIIELVGYSDMKYFSKVFKRIVGLTPIEFRKLYN